MATTKTLLPGETLTVPAGVTQVAVTLLGAAGVTGTASGGTGGKVSFTLAVSAGDVLGCASDLGGVGRNNSGGTACNGGASGILMRNSVEIAWAGGGGGAGTKGVSSDGVSHAGGAGALGGANEAGYGGTGSGGPYGGFGGGNAVGNTPGGGGGAGPNNDLDAQDGQPGSTNGTGGAGGYGTDKANSIGFEGGGGGGGAGYAGGGGGGAGGYSGDFYYGGAGGGGGGGSSFAAQGTSITYTAGGNTEALSPRATLVYNTSPAVPTNLLPTGNTGKNAQTLSATYSDPDGDSGLVEFQTATDSGFTANVINHTGSTVSSGSTSSKAYTFAANTTYYLRARSKDSAGLYSAYTASQTFTTNRPPATPTVTAPNGGEVWNAVHEITWSGGTDPDGQTTTADIELSTDGGTSWTSLVTGTANDGSHSYDFTDVAASTACKIRIRTKDTLAAYSAWDQSDANFTIEHNRAPYAPLLVSPANGSAADLNAGFVLDWTPQDPDAGDSQSAYRLRRKVEGAAAYEYWNATTAAFQSTEITNTSSTSQVTYAPAVWPNGSTYNFSVATRDSQGADGPYATDFTVTASTGPMVDVTAPAGTVTTTTRPMVDWTYSDLENDPQQSYLVRVFDAVTYGATGFDPATATPVWESGTVASATARNRQIEVDLVQGEQYRAYVQCVGGGQTSAWAYSSFAINVTPPTAPTVTVTDDPALARVLIEVQGTDPGPTYDSTNSTFHVERSADGGDSWTTVRGASRLPMDAAQFALAQDYEQRLSVPALYRASMVGDV